MNNASNKTFQTKSLPRYSKQDVKNLMPYCQMYDITCFCNFSLILLLCLFLQSASAFVHPGLLHTQADFDRMAQKVASKTSPWVDSWNILINNTHAQLSYNPDPQPVVARGVDCAFDNSATLFNDVAAAYQLALRWKISGNTSYAEKAVQIMDAWSNTLREISCPNGTKWDYILTAGIQGYQFSNAAEIMRTYPGWDANNFTRFQNMMRNIFFPINYGNIIHNVNFTKLPDSLSEYANWDLGSLASIMAIGVLTDNQTMFDYAIDYFKTGRSNGAIPQTIYYLHPGYLGQVQEAGRDQGHDTLDIAHLGVISEMAWNQGINLYGYTNNRILAGAEYVAKGNLKETETTYYSVPYAPYKFLNYEGQIEVQNEFSIDFIGTLRPCWTSIYNHYVNRKGLAAPYTEKMMNLVKPDGGGGNYGSDSGGFDQLGFETLTFTLDNPAPKVAPSGLTARFTGGEVVLSWWGVANASSYNVKRYNGSWTQYPLNNAPYVLIASNITDLLAYVDVGLFSNTYYYVVTAHTPYGESSPSNIAKVIADPLKLNIWLKFNESGGNIAFDSSGNGHNGVLFGNAKFVSGRSQGTYAVSLDGNNSYVSIPARIIDDLSDFTITAWLYLNEQQIGARLFDFGFGVVRWMMFSPQGGNGNATFAISVHDQFGAWSVEDQGPLPIKKWVHVAISLLGKSATFRVDGQVVGINKDIVLTPYQMALGTDASQVQNWLGRSQYQGGPYLNGLIDDFRIYQGALTANQISNLLVS